jgi:hypothetical protein
VLTTFEQTINHLVSVTVGPLERVKTEESHGREIKVITSHTNKSNHTKKRSLTTFWQILNEQTRKQPTLIAYGPLKIGRAGEGRVNAPEVKAQHIHTLINKQKKLVKF